MNASVLIKELQNRADGSLERLKLHYGPLIRYVIRPILSDERDQEEVFSDILVRVWDRIDQYDPQNGSWTNWLSTIARNAAIDRARRNPPPGRELTETIPAPNSDPEQELLRKERQRELYAALSALDHGEKALFYRKYYYRQSTAQIAAEYGTTGRAIEGRLYRIKRKLRKTLGGDFYDG
ncbi:MAG: sigma-70 family RNA polymerase sigma factor [Oscillospiraceae bacterium]|nr:sigma-70 family RNA polymerase sigma factor [Oscillospiraceae bacterium]